MVENYIVYVNGFENWKSKTFLKTPQYAAKAEKFFNFVFETTKDLKIPITQYRMKVKKTTHCLPPPPAQLVLKNIT